ncbi:MAG: hypothetical protein LBJ93_02740 [Clostridiales bacterium]|jgi:hypothetical protein|nr:hypothetical protein [Clostridiales bacterium]
MEPANKKINANANGNKRPNILLRSVTFVANRTIPVISDNSDAIAKTIADLTKGFKHVSSE